MIKAANLSDPGAFRDYFGIFLGPRIHWSGLCLLEIFRDSQKLEQRSDWLCFLCQKLGGEAYSSLKPSFFKGYPPFGMWTVEGKQLNILF